jgi:hypothetical protein
MRHENSIKKKFNPLVAEQFPYHNDMLTETDSGSLGSNKRSTEADPTSSLLYLKIRELSLYHIRYTALFNESRNGFQRDHKSSQNFDK